MSQVPVRQGGEKRTVKTLVYNVNRVMYDLKSCEIFCKIFLEVHGNQRGRQSTNNQELNFFFQKG